MGELPPRVMAKIQMVASGCWEWCGARTNHGYGNLTIKIEGKRRWRNAHRFVYEALVGPVPDGLELDHLCRVRHCVNPDHLEPVTPWENNHRSPISNASKTHCPAGHPYDEKNTGINRASNGRVGRRCRACDREKQRRKHAKLRGEAA